MAILDAAGDGGNDGEDAEAQQAASADLEGFAHLQGPDYEEGGGGLDGVGDAPCCLGDVSWGSGGGPGFDCGGR